MAANRVLIYVRNSREWYRREGCGVTKNRDEAHRYTRGRAEVIVGFDADLEIQPAPRKQPHSQGHSEEKP